MKSFVQGRSLEAGGCPEPGSRPLGVCPAMGRGVLIIEVAPATLHCNMGRWGRNVEGKTESRENRDRGRPEIAPARVRYQGLAVVEGADGEGQDLPREGHPGFALPCHCPPKVPFQDLRSPTG